MTTKPESSFLRLRSLQRRRQRGLSLIEMMVGLLVGMVVSAGAAALFLAQMDANRRLLLETRVQQDLRATADLIARDLRRAGYWQNSLAGATHPPLPNPFQTTTLSSENNEQSLTYSLDPRGNSGFRRNNDVIQVKNGTNWQDLTDPNTLRITRFNIIPAVQDISLGQYCMPACTSANTQCPYMRLRSYTIELEGNSPFDTTIRRQLRLQVKLRNDEVPRATCPSS